MKLSNFDDKIVKLEDIFGNTYEGIAIYNNEEYNYHEYGKNEESIVLDNIMFFKSLILNIEEIKDFSSKYGYLEEEVIEAGIDIIDEVLDSEDNISIYRLLLCIKDKLDTFYEKEELFKLLDRLIKYNDDEKNIELAKEILNN